MNINKVTAIFDESCLKEVESALLQHGVKGFTLYPVRGRGYNFDSFNEKKHLIKHIQLEVYVKTDQAKAIAQVIVEAAHVNADSEGLVCIIPVNDLIWIHDKRRATVSDFHFHI
tara:strand:- start:11931 stop:12272 length:342 start_codon:yes stop_codon:yes gene_type:complete